LFGSVLIVASDDNTFGVFMNPVSATGLAGIQAGLNTAQSGAQKIAAATVTAPAGNEAVDSSPESNNVSAGLSSLTEGVVELVQGEQQVQASAVVVGAADEALGTLVDVVA
jgi:hypothetical protein